MWLIDSANNQISDRKKVNTGKTKHKHPSGNKTPTDRSATYKGIYKKRNGAPWRIRTFDRSVRSRVLYPAELRVRYFYSKTGGERGIRTLDTLLGYAPLAGEYLRPLGHLTIGFVVRWILLCSQILSRNKLKKSVFSAFFGLIANFLVNLNKNTTFI